MWPVMVDRYLPLPKGHVMGWGGLHFRYDPHQHCHCPLTTAPTNQFINLISNLGTDGGGRRVILFMNDCFCEKKFCKERAALAVQSCLKKVKLKDCAKNFSIDYAFNFFCYYFLMLKSCCCCISI